MKLNVAQRIILSLGLALMFLVGAFPSKLSDYNLGNNRLLNSGRVPIWETSNGRARLLINRGQLFTEWAVIALGTGAGVLAMGLLKPKDDDTSGDSD